MHTGSGYRADIDGLRAIAILSVLVFHYGATWLPGGFAGVDVFFVISGYLITKHLHEDISNNGHAIGPLLVRFYNKRIRRILPALLAVLAATLVSGWFFLLPGDYTATGDSAVYSAFGLGNLYFYRNTGYFDQAASMQPLLHMWSLGVEEQFYFLWPLLLVGFMWASRGRRPIVALLTALLVVTSFALAVYFINTDPKAAFYLPFPRAWELGIGALLAFLPSIRGRAASEIAGAVGLGAIAWSLLWLGQAESSLGLAMVPAVVGAALVVWPRENNWTARLLAVAPMRAIGLISYSLYLWHWPVLVLFRFYANGDMPNAREAIGLTAVTLALSVLSWRFVERPARQASTGSWSVIGAGLATASVISLAGAAIVHFDGIKSRIPSELEKLSSLSVMWQWQCPRQMTLPGLGHSYCNFGKPWDNAATKALVWGDSHAQHMAPLIEVASAARPDSFLLYGPCPAALGGHVRRERKDMPDYVELCRDRRARAVELLKANPTINLVVLSASWTNMSRLVSQDGTFPAAATRFELVAHGIRTLIEETAGPGRRFVVIADVPQLKRDPIPCAVGVKSHLARRQCDLSRTTVSIDQFNKEQGRMYDVISGIAEKRSDTVAVLPGRSLCKGDWCTNYLNGEFLYRDAGHIRRNLSRATQEEYADTIGLTDALRMSDTAGLSDSRHERGSRYGNVDSSEHGQSTVWQMNPLAPPLR